MHILDEWPRRDGKVGHLPGLAEMCFADGRLGASFFCSQNFEDRRNLHIIFPAFAFQLARRYPRFRKELIQFLRASPNVRQESLYSQTEKLIVGPLNPPRSRL